MSDSCLGGSALGELDEMTMGGRGAILRTETFTGDTFLRSRSILYVEDNDDIRETIGMLLEGEAREVVLCASSEAALAALAQREFDILITDVSLPGLSGTELARRVLAKNPAKWVVLCSGYEFGDSLQTLGPNVRSLSKPFEPEELERLLAEIFAAAPSG